VYVAQRGRRTRWQSNYTLSVRHAPLCSEFSLGLAFELDALGVVHMGGVRRLPKYRKLFIGLPYNINIQIL
jgi:hypothetical protein